MEKIHALKTILKWCMPSYLKLCQGLHHCFSTGVLLNLRVPPVVSKGSVGPPVLSKNIKLRPTFAATRRVF